MVLWPIPTLWYQTRLSITIEGTNDKPIVSLAPALSTTENSAAVLTGRVEVTDYEQTNGTGFTFSLVTAKDLASTDITKQYDLASDDGVMQGTYGTLKLDQLTGLYSYTRNTKDLNYLNNGESVTDTFYVRVKDANGAYSDIKPIVVTINGQDDGANVSTSTGGVHLVEDGVAAGANAQHGIFHYTQDGYLGYNNPVSIDLNTKLEGNVLVSDPDSSDANNYKTFSYTVAGGSNASVVDNLDGTYTLYDGADHSEEHRYGTLTLTDRGNYKFEPRIVDGHLAENINSLAEGESVTVTVTVNVTAYSADGAAENATGSFNVVITGTNDAPVVAVNSGIAQDLNAHGISGNEHKVSVSGDVAATDAFGGHAVEIGTGASAIHLVFGSSANDGIDLSTSNPTESHVLYGGGGDDTLYGGNGGDYLFGGANNDHLQGGAGVDHLYGGANDDFLDGKGSASGDFLDGGEGNDLLVFNHNDTVDGGTGINVLLVKDAASDVDSLFADHGHVKNIAVMLTGAAASLTDARELHDNLGITLDNTNTSVTLDSSKWTAVSGSNYSWSNNTDGSVLTVADGSHSSVDDEAAKIVIQLQNHQG